MRNEVGTIRKKKNNTDLIELPIVLFVSVRTNATFLKV